jgi:hypothetical protein
VRWHIVRCTFCAAQLSLTRGYSHIGKFQLQHCNRYAELSRIPLRTNFLPAALRNAWHTSGVHHLIRQLRHLHALVVSVLLTRLLTLLGGVLRQRQLWNTQENLRTKQPGYLEFASFLREGMSLRVVANYCGCTVSTRVPTLQ